MRILVAAVLLSILTFGAVNAQNQCILEDFVINIRGSAQILTVGSACSLRDEAFALAGSSSGILVGGAKGRLSTRYCIGILAEIASDNEGSVMHFLDSSAQSIGGITLTSSEISIFVGDNSVTFPIDATGERYFQICSDDGSNVQLYEKCDSSPSQTQVADLSLDFTAMISLYKDIFNATSHTFRRSVTQLYFLSCTGPDVRTQDVVNLQCQANPPDCAQNNTNLVNVVNDYVEDLNTPKPTPPPEDPECSGRPPEVSSPSVFSVEGQKGEKGNTRPPDTDTYHYPYLDEVSIKEMVI